MNKKINKNQNINNKINKNVKYKIKNIKNKNNINTKPYNRTSNNIKLCQKFKITKNIFKN